MKIKLFFFKKGIYYQLKHGNVIWMPAKWFISMPYLQNFFFLLLFKADFK